MTFAKIAAGCAKWMGHPYAFVLNLGFVAIWAACGPYFDYSTGWQLVINSSTTVLTYLGMFLIQNEQNRQGCALQLKLDELIRVSEARNELIGIEKNTEADLEKQRPR